MSNQVNYNLLERANSLLEEISNHPSGYDTLLQKAVDGGDLEEVKHWVTVIEGYLSQESFHNYDAI